MEFYTYYDTCCCAREWITQIANLHAKYHIITTSCICSQSLHTYTTDVSDYHSTVAVSTIRVATDAIGQRVIRIAVGVEPYFHLCCINL